MKTVLLVATLVASTAAAATLDEGVALKQQNRLAEAESVLAEVVREHPDDPKALGEWATVLGWLGRFDDSIAAWSRALAKKPGDPDAALALARVEYWKGDLGAARRG